MFFLSKLCILCLSTCKKIKPELIEKNEEILIQKKLKYCLPEIIDSHSVIPTYVCSNCIYKLECFYNFKQICIQNNTYLKSYCQTLTSTAGESYKYLLVKLTDIKYQNKEQAVSIDQTMLIVGTGSDDQLRTGENEYNGIYINEVVKNEAQCVDELNIEESHLSFETENNIEIKEELLTYDIELYNAYVKSIKCGSISSDFDVSISRIEDSVHENSKYSNSNREINWAKSTEKKVTENNEKTKIFTCPICNKEFRCKRLLKYHLKVHAGIRDYECSVCTKRFYLKGVLTQHEKTHTGIKNHECSICKKKFLLKSSLLRHERSHTGVKSYECALCKKKFTRKGNLIRHKKIHTGIKNYECALCKKRFIEKNQLIRHEKIHTGIKNYECSICKKKFLHKTNLIRHENIHTGIKTTNVHHVKKSLRKKMI